MRERNRLGELRHQQGLAPTNETDARLLHEAVQQGELVPGMDVPVVLRPPTPGGPDGDATGCP